MIEQVQRQPANSTGTINLDFNHPIKEIMWVICNETFNKGTLDVVTKNYTVEEIVKMISKNP